MHRELTDKEKMALYKEGCCPFCGSKEFYEGPSGGLCTNWYCSSDACGAGFNLSMPPFGELIREPGSHPPVPRALAEPCMDPNPWDGAATFHVPHPAPPCGRPRGHGKGGAGSSGATWGGGHSEQPGKDDPPTKRIIRIERWEVEL